MHEEMQVMEQLCYYPVHERVTKERIAKQYGWTLRANEIHVVEGRRQNRPSYINESQFQCAFVLAQLGIQCFFHFNFLV